MRTVFFTLALLVSAPLHSYADWAPVRVDDTSGSHCIDATSEDITLHVRRIFTEKTSGLLTEDSHAGVIVSSKMTGVTAQEAKEIETPSVTLVSVKDEKDGRISLPLEYPIASYFPLTQGNIRTTDMALYVSLARTRDSNSFGDLIDVASKALAKLPIPPNPYSLATSKLLAFANDAIADQKKKKFDEPVAQLSLAFNKGKEPDLNKCKSMGKERTGVIAVLQNKGSSKNGLIPMENTEKAYCFRYSSSNTYELLAAKRTTTGQCPSESDYNGVRNNYVMFILSANPSSSTGVTIFSNKERQSRIEESSRRCKSLGLEENLCGVRKTARDQAATTRVVPD